MEPQIHIPRWTPNLSQTQNNHTPSSSRLDESELQSIVSEDDNNMEKLFPFSSGSGAVNIDIEMQPSPEHNNKQHSKGIFITWNDLQVTVPDAKKERRHILRGLTGYAEPGEVLAIMGPSGSGKSTLLDALAGRISSTAHQTGEILINGRKEALAFGTSTYVTQDDTLMTTLTVREAVYYSAQLQLPKSMSKSEKRERAEMTIREMGLQDCVNTRIGGWSKKGISGGQKRRVSICIEILTRPKLLFLDEPTSGLDSASSYHVMNRIVKLANQDGRTVIASIHQPSTEVFQLFHNLCLLSSGTSVYFGPVSMAEQFFSSNGFPCPNRRNPSDHYLRTINKDFMEVEDELGGSTKLNSEEVIDVLVKSYQSSQIWQHIQKHVAYICAKKGENMKKKGRQTSYITQCIVLTKRSFVNMYRDLGYYWLRLAIYIALCLCVGTIFHDIGFSYGSIQARGAMLMFVAAFLTFMAIGGFPSFVEDMKIFERERLNGHYGVGAFVIGNSLSSIPYLLMISLIPGAIAYYLVGLQKSFDHFVYFLLILFACMMLVESLMMIVASVVPDFLMGIITGAGIQGVMMLNGGFFRLPNDLPKPFWRYPMYYIAFHKYANQGFYKNEFQGLTFPNNQVGGSSTISGEDILQNVWQVEIGYSKWVDLGILLGMVVIYRLIFLGIIKIAEKVKPIIVTNYYGCLSFAGGQISQNPSSSP
ncbi:ABC transporter G family member 1-like [Euphorbia lathyris]|uniref:ABC transporter G family member 1-like n=1 Tax=Euphorbia lathyris TaxID=212925 RepID=UPI003313A09C